MFTDLWEVGKAGRHTCGKLFLSHFHNRQVIDVAKASAPSVKCRNGAVRATLTVLGTFN